MESSASKIVKASALFTFSLLLFTSAFADLTVVSPRDGVTVSLLKDAQREYLALPANARRERMGDAAARAVFAKCGGRPASVTLKWQDTAFDTNVVYAIELKRAGAADAECFEVIGAQQAELVNLETGCLYAWKVSRKGGDVPKVAAFKTAAGPRLMFIPGVANCRDLGGNGLRQGRVYRTAAYNGSSKKVGESFFDTKFVPGMVRITKSGRREMVEKCGIKTDLDLRNEQECAGMSLSPLGTNVVWTHIPIRAYGWLDNDKSAMGKILKVFADERNYPIAFHCAGGRDRAGSVAFILEGLCAVAEDKLMADWELSIFDTDDLGFAPSRIDGLVDMLSRYSGETLNERIVSFVKACGVTDEEIAQIRANLMEK